MQSTAVGLRGRRHPKPVLTKSWWGRADCIFMNTATGITYMGYNMSASGSEGAQSPASAHATRRAPPSSQERCSLHLQDAHPPMALTHASQKAERCIQMALKCAHTHTHMRIACHELPRALMHGSDDARSTGTDLRKTGAG